MFIYLVTNRVNGKRYVGQHSGNDLQKYWKKHVYRALSGPDRVRAIYSAIRKYGSESFEIESLLEVETKEELNFHEARLIKELNTKVPFGYNLTDGGDGVLNPSDESRLKMSEPHKGKVQPKETIIKRAESLRGFKHTEETKQKMSQAQLGNQYALGREVSEETRQKISEGNLGNKNALGAYRSPEYRKKLSDVQKGRKLTSEHKLKLSEAAKKRANTEEGRKHLSAAAIEGVRLRRASGQIK